MVQTISVEEASSLIGLVYDSALDGAQWQRLTTRLSEMCPGHVSAVVTFEDARWVSSHVPTLPEGAHGDAITDLMEDVEDGAVRQPDDLNDTLFRRQPLALGTLYATRAIFSEAEFRAFEGYKTTMKPIGAGHWTGSHFSISGGKRAAIMVVENDFDPLEKDHVRVADLIRLIAPHMVRAARFARTLTLAREAAETFAGFVDAIALPLLVLTQDGRLQVANTMGQRLLDAAALVRVGRDGRLRLAEDTAALKDAIDLAAEDGGPHAFRVDLEDEGLVVCVCPYLPGLSQVSKIDQRLYDEAPLFAVLVGARPTGAINTRLLRDAFGLTEREADVCRGLMDGLAPNQLAAQAGRSEKTIRNQIHAVHDKVGVTSTRDLTESLAVFRSVGAMYTA